MRLLNNVGLSGVEMGEKISLVEAVDMLNEAFGNDPKKSGRNVVSKKTLYNKICKKEIKAYGSKHFRQVDKDEILRVWGPQTA